MDCRLMDLDVGDMNEFMNGLKAWIHNIFFKKNWIEHTWIRTAKKKVFKFILSYYFIKNWKKRHYSIKMQRCQCPIHKSIFEPFIWSIMWKVWAYSQQYLWTLYLINNVEGVGVFTRVSLNPLSDQWCGRCGRIHNSIFEPFIWSIMWKVWAYFKL